MSATICFVQLGVHAHFEPYETPFKNIMQYVSYTLVAFAAFSGMVINYIDVSARLASASLQFEESKRLRDQEEHFKAFTAVVIWTGTVVIIIQLVYYVVKFCLKHRARIRRFGIHASSVITRLTSRTSSRAASDAPSLRKTDDMELTMVQTIPRHASANCEPDAGTASGSQDMTTRDWHPNPVVSQGSPEDKS